MQNQPNTTKNKKKQKKFKLKPTTLWENLSPESRQALLLAKSSIHKESNQQYESKKRKRKFKRAKQHHNYLSKNTRPTLERKESNDQGRALSNSSYR